MNQYKETFCFTPVGPCVSAQGPDPAKVVGMILFTATALFVGFKLAEASLPRLPRSR